MKGNLVDDDKYIEITESSLAVSRSFISPQFKQGRTRILPLGRMRHSCSTKGRDPSMIKGRAMPKNHYI